MSGRVGRPGLTMIAAAVMTALLTLGGATSALGQTGDGPATLSYEVDLNDRADDLFHVRMLVSDLGPDNAVLQFASTAPGTYQVMDIGRYVRKLDAFTASGTAVPVEQISTNQWRLSDPAAVAEIRYSIAETWDTPVDEHQVYPMAGTSIEEDHVLINAHAVFPFPEGMQDAPVELRLEYPTEWKIGTPLDAEEDGTRVSGTVKWLVLSLPAHSDVPRAVYCRRTSRGSSPRASRAPRSRIEGAIQSPAARA